MNKRVAIFLLLMAVFFSRVQAKSSVQANVRLIDTVAVRAPLVSLGEIAHIESPNESLKKQLIHLVVGEAPQMGRSRIISSFRIKGILKKEGVDGVQVYGVQSLVNTESKKLSRDEMKEKIIHWAERNAEGSKEVKVDFVRLPQFWKIPEGEEVDIQVSSVGSAKHGGYQSLTLRSLVGDRVMSSQHVRIKISYFDEVPVIVRPLKKGSVLEKIHVTMRRAEVTGASGMEVGQAEDLLGMVAKRDLSVGSLLSLRDFERPVLIERGSINRLLILNGSVRMKVSGAEALQNGRMGDIILFSNPMNKRKNLKAKVLKQGLAAITLN